MRKLNEYYPERVSHPGTTLKEKLEELGIGPKEFAIKSDKPEKTISAILNEESAITPDMAVLFERVLKIPAKFWLQRQLLFDEYVARKRAKEKIEESMDWIKDFPIREMIKCMWLPDVRQTRDKAEALLNFFGVASYGAWEKYYLTQELKVAFRISLAHTNKPQSIAAWLRQGEILASKVDGPSYSKNSFEDILMDLKKIMAKHPKNFAEKIQKKTLEAGVKVVYTPCLPKAPISGATRWLNDNPIIQLSGRYKRNDSFWFTFFHEAGHIIKHGKKEVFLENVEYSEKDKLKEEEANEFARTWTLSHEQFQEIISHSTLTKTMIEDFAERFVTHPALIIGRLQREGKIPYSVGHGFIEPVDLN